MAGLAIGVSYLLWGCFLILVASGVSLVTYRLLHRRSLAHRRVILGALAAFLVTLVALPGLLTVSSGLWQGRWNTYHLEDLVGNWRAGYLAGVDGDVDAEEVIRLYANGTYDQEVRIAGQTTPLLILGQPWRLVDGHTVELTAARCVPCCWHYFDMNEAVHCLGKPIADSVSNKQLLRVWVERLPRRVALEHRPVGDPDAPVYVRLYSDID